MRPEESRLQAGITNFSSIFTLLTRPYFLYYDVIKKFRSMNVFGASVFLFVTCDGLEMNHTRLVYQGLILRIIVVFIFYVAIFIIVIRCCFAITH